ncbi:MAG: hypothetical protein PHH77_03350 [Victivallaceae bacterium]|nr:hypothetical protein [Victivallaceae bacterium]
MKINLPIFLLSASLALFPCWCRAQLAMSLKMNRSHYLQYETIYAQVSIRNNSGHSIVFGEDKRLQGKLLFKIIDSQRIPIAAISTASYPMAGIIIDAGQTKKLVVPVSHFYQLKRCDTYRLYAYIEYNQFEDVYRSNDAVFEISEGIVAWEKTVGIPDFSLSGKPQQIKNRTYKMVCLTEGSRKSNYLVIEDKKRVYNVIFISHELGEERISYDTDQLSRLHLMIPMTPKIFVYLIVDINGKIDEESVYKRTQTVPSLVRNPETGKVYVTGGNKADKEIDYR